MLQGRTISLPLIVLILTTGLLASLGISGIARGDELDPGSPFAPRQVMWLAMAAVAAVIGWMIPYQRFKGFSYFAFGVTLILLVAVYFFPPRNGSRRWIPLGPISMQPSEAQLAFLLALSEYLMFRKNHRTFIGLIPPFLMTLAPVLLILKEPDLGTSLLFFPVLFALLYTAGAKRWHLAVTLIAGIAVVPVVWQFMSLEQKSRVTAVFQQNDNGIPDMGDGYHLHQSKQLLSLGGVWGSEWSSQPVDDPAAYRLPAGRTDFVFCLVGERWGVPGTLSVLAMFAVFVVCGLHLSATTRDPFGRLVATGIVTILAAQVMINTAMTVGLAPITGLTLPLLSYGGSSLITTGLSLGLLFNIAQSPGFDVAGQPFQYSDS